MPNKRSSDRRHPSLAGFAGYALVLGAALLALLAHGGRWSWQLDLLPNFAFLFLAGALWGVVMLLRRRARPAWFYAVTIVGLAASATLFIEPGLQKDRIAACPAGRVRIIQFNLERHLDTQRTIAWIDSQAPDIIVFQDPTPGIVIGLTSPGGRRHAIVLPSHELAIVSKTPASSYRYYDGELYGLTPSIIVAAFDAGGAPFTFVGTHLARPYFRGPDSPHSSVVIQHENAVRLAAILADEPRSTTVLAGDFNAAPWTFARRRQSASLGLERRTGILATWPANKTGVALLPIDHVYAGEMWRTVQVRRGPDLGSDHYPVVVDLCRPSIGH